MSLQILVSNFSHGIPHNTMFGIYIIMDMIIMCIMNWWMRMKIHYLKRNYMLLKEILEIKKKNMHAVIILLFMFKKMLSINIESSALNVTFMD